MSEGRTVDPRTAVSEGAVEAWRGGYRLSLRRVGDVAEVRKPDLDNGLINFRSKKKLELAAVKK